MKKIFCLMMALGILLVAMPVGAEEVWYFAETSHYANFSVEIEGENLIIKNNSRNDIQIRTSCDKPLLNIEKAGQISVLIIELIGEGIDSHRFSFPQIPRSLGSSWLKIMRVKVGDAKEIIHKNWNSESSVFIGIESTSLFCE